MKKVNFVLPIILLSFIQLICAQENKTDANIFGHVICVDCDEHLSFATIIVEGTTIGTSTDETGHYQLINLPPGTHVIKADYMGYLPQKKVITIHARETMELNFELNKDFLGIEEVIITGDRTETNKKSSMVIVNTITQKQFSANQAATLSEGLNFCPGLRIENNCSNCGFSQVRMNGMEGPYSQILINSRPVFSGLAGVYGLELIPSNMIERVEVIRGGGSALYGSNAIAGTINLILKDPVNNSYEAGITGGILGTGVKNAGRPAQDYTLQFNTSLVSSDSKTGMALYGFYRDREPFDANSDDFSEIAKIKNTTIGTRLFHRFSVRGKFTADFFNIKEDRRGGDRFNYPVHEANIAEAVNHNLTAGAFTYEKLIRESDRFSIYASGQRINRDSYYGAKKSLKDYGNTINFTSIIGTQYYAVLGRSGIIAGIENEGEWLNDQKLGYPDVDNPVVVNDTTVEILHTDNLVIANQTKNTTGIFAQYEINLKTLKVSAGARFDNYKIVDHEKKGYDKSGNVLNPRITLKYDIKEFLQARLSYSQGYRAPQIFDEDLHIETSGSRKVIHRNSPDLKQETSHSFMASMTFNKQLGKLYLGFLVEGFYTQLNNPFANIYSVPDAGDTVIYIRVNSESGAVVRGVNIEMNMVPTERLSLKAGFTFQSSMYKEAQEFDEKRFFRTPDDYGYFTLDWQTTGNLGISSTANYTGKMLVPYFGFQIPDPDNGELRESQRFFDMGIRFRYNIKLNGSTVQLFAGMRNIFNSYQNDFDTGIDRDPGYIYGPVNPRSIYLGLKIGNFLKQ
ncbi:MAG TPA: TonB-dependent receptor [Bacteroidaceae bacterium]|nr:TonB-dependent receptor [Bacteroidaceae bacterium]